MRTQRNDVSCADGRILRAIEDVAKDVTTIEGSKSSKEEMAALRLFISDGIRADRAEIAKELRKCQDVHYSPNLRALIEELEGGRT